MKNIKGILAATAVILGLYSCGNTEQKSTTTVKDTVTTGTGQNIPLPDPYATKSAHNFAKILGWDNGRIPTAPTGFTVSRFADGMKSPRWIYQAPNGDIFVTEANTEDKGIRKVEDKVVGRDKSLNTGASANLVLLLRDTNGDGIPDVRDTFLAGLDRPFGMLALNNYFYVACTDGLWRYPYQAGQTKLTGGQKILDLPKGGYNNHWTRNILPNADGSKLYVTVGSGSNAGEHGPENEVRRANILEINPDGTGEKIYAYGLRNPVGMGWEPNTHKLWAAVNERDELGDELVPDYITSVKEGGFYGWPYSYFGQHEDPRLKDHQRPDLVQKAIVPDLALGAHTASLGFTFYNKTAFPAKYQGGAFIGQHGSWNRSQLAGYRVVFVPFKNGMPSGPAEDFLTGFIAPGKSEVYGRPVGVTVLADGSMLVADDGANVIWKITANK